jgi:hypothetical protein
MFILKAMFPNGRAVTNSFPSKQYRGYPGGWDIPSSQTAHTISPESCRFTLGVALTKYRAKERRRTAITIT